MSEKDMVCKLLEELQKKKEEILKIYATLQTLKEYGADIELPELVSLLSSSGSTIPSKNITIRPDEFYGLSNTDAAKQYLQKVGHAATLEDIYNALVQGGVPFTGDGKKSLYVQLIRATKRFVKIGKSIGLVESYPKPRGKVIKSADASKEEGQEEPGLTQDNKQLETPNN